jgi:hypothetical protein
VKLISSIRIAVAIGGASALLALTACGGGDREAEAETSVSEAEVTSQLPEEVVSEEQLDAVATAAADAAASPPGSEQVATDAGQTVRSSERPSPSPTKPVSQVSPDPEPHADHVEEDAMIGMRP